MGDRDVELSFNEAAITVGGTNCYGVGVNASIWLTAKGASARGKRHASRNASRRVGQSRAVFDVCERIDREAVVQIRAIHFSLARDTTTGWSIWGSWIQLRCIIGHLQVTGCKTEAVVG